MDERLQLELGRGVVPDAADFRERKLARQHDAGGPEPVKLGCGQVVDDPRLGGDVQRDFRHGAAREHHHAEVGGDERVRARRTRRAEKVRQRLCLRAGGQGVAHEIGARAVFMREGDRPGERVRPEGGRGAHIEQFGAQVDRVRAEAHGGFQLLPAARRGE